MFNFIAILINPVSKRIKGIYDVIEFDVDASIESLRNSVIFMAYGL